MLVIGFIFWNIGLWTAGDAKLFFTLNLLTPPSMITNYYLGHFYGFVFFINIFGVLFLYLFYKIIRNVTKKEFFYSISKTFTIANFLMISLFMFALGTFTRFFPSFLNNYFAIILVFFLMYSILEFFFGRRFVLFLVLIAIGRVVFEYERMLAWDFWLKLLSQILFMFILRFVLLRLSYFAFTHKVKLRELEPGMFLAEDIIPVKILELNEKRKKEVEETGESDIKYKKVKIENLTFIAYLRNKTFKNIDYDKNLGLSKKDLQWLNPENKQLLFKSIRIYETMPFAPIIFAGFMATIFASGNIFLELRLLFDSVYAWVISYFS